MSLSEIRRVIKALDCGRGLCFEAVVCDCGLGEDKTRVILGLLLRDGTVWYDLNNYRWWLV